MRSRIVFTHELINFKICLYYFFLQVFFPHCLYVNKTVVNYKIKRDLP